MIVPQTEVRLLKVPLEIDDLNQLTFTDANAQYNYFNGLPKLVFDNFTYQRKDSIIKLPVLMDDIINYNYVMYRNDAYSDKWFYAFIEDMVYKNDDVTEVAIKTDVWQTWQFDLTFKPVLIDREHANYDTVGSNTYPEGLELGEYVTNQGTIDFGPTTGELYNNYWIVVDVAQIENQGESQTLSYQWISGVGTHPTRPIINGTPSGCVHLLIGTYGESGPDVTIDQIAHLYDVAGLGGSIVSIYILPKALIPEIYYGLELTASIETSSVTEYATATVAIPQGSVGPTTVTESTFTKRTTLNQYVPVNKKLLTYPYSFFNISNNCGTCVPYHYEDFTGDVKFKIISSLGPSGNVKAVPQNYKNIGSNDSCFDFSVTGGKYPICGWTNDSYTNWLTQNGVNMDTQVRTAAIHGIGNMLQSAVTGAAGGPAGLAIGAVSGAAGIVTSQLALAREQHVAKTQANLIPDQVSGNANNSDLAWSYNNNRFTYIPMCIKPEYARKIDAFFSQYGYKCNEVKIPNITGRRNWNYVKTIGCYIEADIPQTDLNEIKSMFNRGITLWHNPATFADYSQNNDII